MSGWGDNPFQGGADNFDDGDSNPFTDQSSNNMPSSQKSATLKKKSKNKGVGAPGSTTGLSDVSSFGGDKYNWGSDDTNDTAFQSDSERFSAQVDRATKFDDSDLACRERELAEREANLAGRESGAAQLEMLNTPNYPPFPKFCCLKPWVVHYIDFHIPDAFKRQQRLYFIYFHFWMLMLWLNVVGCGIQMQTTNMPGLIMPVENPLVSLVLSIVYAVVLTPLGFWCRYWSLYKAFRNGSSVSMILHLIFEFFNIGWSAVLASGMWKFGGAGFQGAMLMSQYNFPFAATWVFISAGLWVLDAVISAACFIYFWYFWRNGGLKFSDPTAEAAKGIASNKTVQNAAVQGVRAGVDSQFE